MPQPGLLSISNALCVHRVVLACLMTVGSALPAYAVHVTSFTISQSEVLANAGSVTASVTFAYGPNEAFRAFVFNTDSAQFFSSIGVVVFQVGDRFGPRSCTGSPAVGGTSITCSLPVFPTVTRQTFTFTAIAGNSNCRDPNLFAFFGCESPDPGGITATLTIDPLTGTIDVTTNLDAATFTIFGPGITYTGSGRSSAITAVSNVGFTFYRITFNPVPGFVTPPPSEGFLRAGRTLQFGGFYEPSVKLTLNLAKPTVEPSNLRGLGIFSLDRATAALTDGNGQPMSGQTITFQGAITEAFGHAHTNFTSALGGSFIDDRTLEATSCQTDATGQCHLDYVVSEVSGAFEVSAGFQNVRTTTPVTVQLNELLATFNIPSPAFTLTGSGGRTTAADCPGANILHPQNHFGSSSLLIRIQAFTSQYFAMTGGTLGVNDMSLVEGGLFDICSEWSGPHNLHRTGHSVDIDGRQVSDGQFVRRRLLEQVATRSGLRRVIEGPIHYELK